MSIKSELKSRTFLEESRSELKTFSKVLHAEALLVIPTIVVLIIFRHSIPQDLMVLSVITVLISLTLSIYGIIAVNRLDHSESADIFLKKAIDFLGAYSASVIAVTLLILLAGFAFYLSSESKDLKQFVFTYASLAFIIMGIIVSYVTLIYGKKIKKLKKIRDQIASG